MYPILIQNKLIEVYSYPFFVGAAVAVAYLLFEFKSNLQNKNLIFFITTIISFLGAKVFYLIVNRNFLIITDQKFWMGGGFVFYGGLIFGGIFLILYFHLKKISLNELNQFILPLVFAHAIGRLGCFLAGCCYGKNHYPLPLVESVFLFFLGFFLYKKNIKNQILVYLLSYGIFRFIVEFFRNDFRGSLFTNFFSPSQEISILIFIILSFNFFFFRKIK
jgi:phosphatidylglycerol:prolipoprotein diacylglycerol transferase